jgi:hypothetical protein
VAGDPPDALSTGALTVTALWRFLDGAPTDAEQARAEGAIDEITGR